ncbi:SymE family type I addiction module toxin, partial [Lonsdalea quercina]|uniref:SymE family type I addiction module toxin n=1 Tax=Lonsdalea quercina TaxID=71657 RepID=UPI003976CD68
HNGKSNPPSAINLKGYWLEESGFDTGCPVTVRIDEGRLILTVERQPGGKNKKAGRIVAITSGFLIKLITIQCFYKFSNH